MDEMNITAAQYVDPYGDGEHSGIQATIDGQEYLYQFVKATDTMTKSKDKLTQEH